MFNSNVAVNKYYKFASESSLPPQADLIKLPEAINQKPEIKSSRSGIATVESDPMITYEPNLNGELKMRVYI